MSTLAHNAVFTSYSAPAKAPAPPAERVVHSTLFSAYEATASSVALSAPAAKAAPAAAKPGLIALWDSWRAARKSAREERELWALAKTDARVMNELNCLLARAD